MDANGLPPKDEPALGDSKEMDEDNENVMLPNRRMTSSQIWDFSFPGQLYCRAKETATLLEAYHRVTQPATTPSKTEFVIISGEAGIGKTSLA
jgi:hypothetical protein